MEYPNLTTTQILTTSQQNLLTEETSYLNSILFALKDLESKNGQYVNLTKNFLSNPELLKLAYYYIKNKPGNVIVTNISETLHDISNDWFEKAVRKIAKGKHMFKNCGRLHIPKTGRKQYCFIKVVNSENKIV